MWALNAAQIASLLLSNPHADFCCCGFFFVPQGTNKCCPLNSSRRWRALIDWRQSDAGRCWTKDDSDVRRRTDFYTSYCLIWRVTMKPWLFEFIEPWKVVVITDHLKAACIRLTSDNLGQVISCWLFRSLWKQTLKDPLVHMEYAAITVCIHAEYPDWNNELPKPQAKRNCYNQKELYFNTLKPDCNTRNLCAGLYWSCSILLNNWSSWRLDFRH